MSSLASVVLPAPFWPTMARDEPAGMVRAHVARPALETLTVGRVVVDRKEGRAMHELVRELGGKPEAEEVDERQVDSYEPQAV